MAVDLSVLIVSRDSNDYLEACLQSIPGACAGLSCQVIIADNASESLGRIPDKFPDVRWILNKKNLGWGAAVNQAARLARGEILTLLNPDTKLLPGVLAAMQDFFREKNGERLGLAGGTLLFEDGTVQPSCGPFPHFGGLLWRLALPKISRKNYLRFSPTMPAEVDWVSGAFLAIKRSTFEEIGGLDPAFFLYYEDVDLCLRAKKMGLTNYYLPQARAYHYHPHAARRSVSPQLSRIIADSRLKYFKKHRPSWEAWALERLQALERTS